MGTLVAILLITAISFLICFFLARLMGILVAILLITAISFLICFFLDERFPEDDE